MGNTSAVEYLATAYDSMGYKVVAMALREHGPNAAKFKVEISAIEAAIQGTREESAALADSLDPAGKIGDAIRGITRTQRKMKV